MLPITLADALVRLAALEQREAYTRSLLAAAQHQQQLVLNHLHEGLLLLDASGCVVLLNDEYCRQLGLGLPASQWFGIPVLVLAEQVKDQFADPAGFVEDAKRVWWNKQPQLGTELHLADGRVLERDSQPTENGLEAGFLVSYRDVTARHQAEAQLVEQRQFYESILNELPAELFVIDPQSRYRFVNPAAVPDPALRAWMLGRTSAEYNIRRGHPAVLAEQRQARLEAVFASRQRDEWVETMGGDNGPGPRRDVLRRLQPVPEAAGAVRLVIGYGLDVTEREQTRRTLAEQQAFTQQVLDTAPSMIYVRDPAGGFRYQNRALVALALEAGLANPVPGSALAADLAYFAEVDAQVLARNAEVVAEERLTMPDGRVRWYQSVKRPLYRSDGTVHVLGVSTDITDAKEAQLTLVRSEKQYRDLMQYAQALICTYDLAGTTRSVNPALATVLGRPAEELLGQPVAASLLPEDQATFGLYLARIAAEGEAEGEAEGVLRVRPHGSHEVRHLLYHNFVVREPGQEPYVISHAHDITARVQAEQATQRARATAEAVATARENFLANMSHEIRTPMNGVLGVANLLAKTPLTTEQQEYLRIIRSSGQHLLAVLNDVLDMAKITSGKLEMEQVVFNLCDAMGDTLAPLALQAAEKGLAFEGIPLRASCAYPWVIGDAHRLAQILLNLVSNALKFTETGFVKVVGELVSETPDTLTTCFRVTDSGIGIAPAQQARIFESFTQAYTDTNRQYGGTGLGLSISRALVAQLGGTLTLESEVGRGSTFAFTVTLPKAPAPAPAPALAAYDTGRLAGVRLLLVEDNTINRAVVRMSVESWGVLLDEAVDGPAGLAALEAHRYDAVLMDIQMPGLSGVEVTQRLRQLPDPARAATPVIALTANAFWADIDRYLAAGLNDYLIKPFDEEIMYGKLVALLDGPPPPPRYDLTALRQQAQGRTAFIEQILRSFLANMPASLAQLRAAAAAARWPEAAQVAHHIQPNLLALCVADVAADLAVLGRAHRTAPGPLPPPEDLAAAVEHLAAVVTDVLEALLTELASLPY